MGPCDARPVQRPWDSLRGVTLALPLRWLGRRPKTVKIRAERRWPRGNLVRGHPCPPVPLWSPPWSQSRYPDRFHPSPPIRRDASASRVRRGIDKEHAGKDARGPGWTPLQRNPGRANACSPFPGRLHNRRSIVGHVTGTNAGRDALDSLTPSPVATGEGSDAPVPPTPPSRATRRLRGSGVRRDRRVRSPRVVQRPRTRPRTAQ